MQVVVDSLMVQYAREGKGPVVVILHGWADSSKGFEQLRHFMAKRYDVIALDLPGFGGSQMPPSPWGLDNYVEFVSHFLQKIGATDVYALVGHSNGGAIIIRGLARQKLQAQRLVLLSSAGIRGTQRGRNQALLILTKTGKVITMPLPKRIKQKLRSRLYKQVGSDMLVAEHLQESFKKVVADDVQADAPQLDMPVLLLYGEDDADTPVWYGQQFHELIPDSTLEILPGAGHFVHIDRAKDVHAAIAEFLK